MPEMYTKQEVDDAILAAVGPLKAEIKELKGEVGTVWIDQEDAQKLTGRSYSWFYQNRTAGTLPITMMPRTHGSRRVKYSRADCIAYGRKHGYLPPADVA